MGIIKNMRFSYKYLIITNFFLNKRNIRRNGVEGYNTDFFVTTEELRTIGFRNKEEVENILDIMKTEMVRPTDENGDKYNSHVINDYSYGNETYTIIGCTTKNLKQFEKKIKKDFKNSIIKCDRETMPREIKFPGGELMPLYKTSTRTLFWELLKNYPKIVLYGKLIKAIRYNYPGKTDDQLLKNVQNSINSIIINMKKYGFPADTIKNYKGKGYGLIV